MTDREREAGAVAASAPPQPVPLSRGKRMLFSTVLVVLFLASCEGASVLYLRTFEGYDGRHLYQYVYDPYKNILPAPGYVDTRGIRHNSVGFRRSSEIARDKPTGTYRIFLMGASAAYGLGGLWPNIDRSHPVLTNDETIDAYLERDLAGVLPGRRIEVINAAITSTWTHHELIYLNQSILGYQPDMVLFMDGYNDFFITDHGHDQFASYSYNLPGRIILGEPNVPALAYGAGWWLFRKWALFNVLGRAGRLAKLALTPRPAQPPMDPVGAFAGLREVFPRSALAVQRRIGTLLRAENVRAVFMLQPILVLERNRVGATALERRLLDFNVASYRPGYEAFMRAAVPWVREQESRMAQGAGAEFIDLTTAFQDVTGQAYTDYCHLTPFGNQVVARLIAARITPLIRGEAVAAELRHQ
jgi:lysophospholipase L1-like esterase